LLLSPAESGYALLGEANETDKVDHLGDAPAYLLTRRPSDSEAVPGRKITIRIDSKVCEDTGAGGRRYGCGSS
jgi:hypothetical protein